MSFRTAPVLITNLSTSNIAPWWNVGGVFKITKSDLINDHLMVILAPLNKDVVGFDVYDVSVFTIHKAKYIKSRPDRYGQCPDGAARQRHVTHLSVFVW